MMATFMFSLVIVLLAIGGLGLGVVAGRAPIKGSCGGVAGINGINCGLCKARAKCHKEGET